MKIHMIQFMYKVMVNYYHLYVKYFLLLYIMSVEITSIVIIGVGIIGSAIKKSFETNGIHVYAYDTNLKYDTLELCTHSNIIFLCLPTLFNDVLNEFDKSQLYTTCEYLSSNNYNGIIVIKSTIEPTTTNLLNNKYNNLKIVHNPEFLSAKTAYEDFHHQSHIVIGQSDLVATNSNNGIDNINNEIHDININLLISFYKKYYPNAEISICASSESELMKLFVNNFYSVKIQFFNELYLTCEAIGSDYNVVKNLMIKNGWINSQHTNVPGPDGKLSYGGMCFPKDTNALLQYMKKNNIPCGIIDATINEHNDMRKDN
jgi:nucleotide sugar dehydrogenase